MLNARTNGKYMKKKCFSSQKLFPQEPQSLKLLAYLS